MIPQKLQLKNFLSYGSTFQTIDFGNHHLICLSGKNGHGKSALLDAITWTIWGQARKISGMLKPDSQLLRLGQTHMVVIFDFHFNGSTYRIRREYSQTYNKPYAALDFALIDSESNKVVPLTDKTIRDTQAKIETILGLDYESFINSAFLRQGQANEFSKKSPKERKDILANILNLQQYENVRKRAHEKIKQLSVDLQINNQRMEQLDQELLVTATLSSDMQKLAEQLDILEVQIKTKKSEIDSLYCQQKQQEQIQAQLTVLTFKKNELEARQTEREAVLSDTFFCWRSINRHVRQFSSISNLDKEKEQLINSLNKIQQKLQLHLQNKERLLQCKEQEQKLLKQLNDNYNGQLQEHTIINEGLKLEKKLLIDQCKNLEQRLIDHQKEIDIVDEQLKLLIKEHESHSKDDTLEKQFEKRKSFYQLWSARLQNTRIHLDELNHKKKLVQESINPCCPLCEQNLSASRKRFLKIKFIKVKQRYHYQINKLSNVLKQLKQALIEQHEHILVLKQKEQEKQKTAALVNEFTKQRNKLSQIIEVIKQELEKTKITIETNQQQIKMSEIKQEQVTRQLQLRLLTDPSLNAIKKEIEQTEEELKKYSIETNQHQLFIDRLQQLDKEKEQYNKLLQEKDKQQARVMEIQQLCTQIRLLKKEHIRLNHQIKSIQQSQIICSIENKIRELSYQISELQKNKEQIMHEQGRFEQTKEQRQRNEKELKELQIKKNISEQTIENYQLIATAVGKEGIQALLIEEALPEIEQEANVLLAQLTDSQSHIFIDSLRDLKKGGTKETLDIKISDTMGIRPYELFSGGEAFRIDFALRIAISKLLARRAGTSLQTLIIDEGFGSQDEEGLTHLMDALYKIQDNFAKVIIVSHLPILKEQFPVHFLVEKGPQGSSVRIIENG